MQTIYFFVKGFQTGAHASAIIFFFKSKLRSQQDFDCKFCMYILRKYIPRSLRKYFSLINLKTYHHHIQSKLGLLMGSKSSLTPLWLRSDSTEILELAPACPLWFGEQPGLSLETAPNGTLFSRPFALVKVHIVAQWCRVLQDLQELL